MVFGHEITSYGTNKNYAGGTNYVQKYKYTKKGGGRTKFDRWNKKKRSFIIPKRIYPNIEQKDFSIIAGIGAEPYITVDSNEGYFRILLNGGLTEGPGLLNVQNGTSRRTGQLIHCVRAQLNLRLQPREGYTYNNRIWRARLFLVNRRIKGPEPVSTDWDPDNDWFNNDTNFITEEPNGKWAPFMKLLKEEWVNSSCVSYIPNTDEELNIGDNVPFQPKTIPVELNWDIKLDTLTMYDNSDPTGQSIDKGALLFMIQGAIPTRLWSATQRDEFIDNNQYDHTITFASRITYEDA